MKTLWKLEFYSNSFNGKYSPNWELVQQLYLSKDTAIAKAKEFLSGDAFKHNAQPDIEVLTDEIEAHDCRMGDIDEGATNYDDPITVITRHNKTKEVFYVEKKQTESVTVDGNVYTRNIMVKVPQEKFLDYVVTVICSESEYSLCEEVA